MDAKQTRQGVLLALAAYFIWGIAPAYFKLIYYVPADEILTHRVICCEAASALAGPF